MWQNAIHKHNNLSDVEQSHIRHCNECVATSVMTIAQAATSMFISPCITLNSFLCGNM